MLAGEALLRQDKTSLSSKPRTYQDLYPALLTVTLFAIYGPAVIRGVHLAQEPNCRYWVGSYPAYLVLAIPVLILIGHASQAYRRRPNYPAIIISGALPALLCVVIAYFYNVGYFGISSDFLLSTDCTTFVEKFHVEQAYQAAKTFLDECVTAEAKNQSKSTEFIRANTVISQCPGYDPHAAGYPREWEYLQSLEEQEHCAGWCNGYEEALWTHNPPNWNSCSLTAGITFAHGVSRNATLMFCTGMMGFLVLAATMLMINEWVKKSDDPALKTPA